MDTSPDHVAGGQHEVEVILLKQVASYLATAIFLVDPRGTLVYYNEPAERLLGDRRHITVTAFPLVGQHDRELGAVAIFWETAEQ